MNGIENLFAFGYATDTVTIKGINITLTVLDSRRVADALNATLAANSIEATARNITYFQQILARAITSINGEQQFADINNPTNEEIENMLSIVEKLHYSVINKLYDTYEKLDNGINKDIEEQVKK